MSSRAPSRLRPRAIVLGGFGVILAWLVITRSFAAYFAEVAPQTALWLNSRQPEALVNLADRSLNIFAGTPASPAAAATPAPQANSPGAWQSTDDSAAAAADRDSPRPGDAVDTAGAANNREAFSRDLSSAFTMVDRNASIDLATVRRRLESALTEEPLNARAVRLLGQVANTANDNSESTKLMEAAARLSLHESVAVYWMMRKSVEAGDYQAAIAYADALLRTDRGLDQYVMPELAHFAENKASNALIKAVLKDNPPWRDRFFGDLLSSITDARTPLDLLLALRNTPAPPTSLEIRDYVEFLIAHHFYDLAYYTWLQFLPSEQLRHAGLLFNGNFELPPSGLPFDWAIAQGSGVTVDIVPLADNGGEHALLVDFLYGRVDYHSISEMTLLAPGSYQFAGRYKGKLVGPRGLKWRVVCAGEAGARLGESTMIGGSAAAWKSTEFSFTVPPANCRAQYVRLDLDARMASEQLVSGSMLFNELQITRVPGPPSAATAAAK